MSLALTANNMGMGVAAGISDVSVLYATIFTFVLTILCILFGTWAGKKFLSKVFGKYSDMISGALLLILGLYEIFF